MTILSVFEAYPGFDVEDARDRYEISGRFVEVAKGDAEPTEEEVTAFLVPSHVDDIQRKNVIATAERVRADALAAIEKKLATGTAAAEVLTDLVTYLKEKT